MLKAGQLGRRPSSSLLALFGVLSSRAALGTHDLSPRDAEFIPSSLQPPGHPNPNLGVLEGRGPIPGIPAWQGY